MRFFTVENRFKEKAQMILFLQYLYSIGLLRTLRKLTPLEHTHRNNPAPNCPLSASFHQLQSQVVIILDLSWRRRLALNLGLYLLWGHTSSLAQPFSSCHTLHWRQHNGSDTLCLEGAFYPWPAWTHSDSQWCLFHAWLFLSFSQI